MANVRFCIHDWRRDPRTDYLRACWEAISAQQRLKRAQIPEPPQAKLPGLMRHQAA